MAQCHTWRRQHIPNYLVAWHIMVLERWWRKMEQIKMGSGKREISRWMISMCRRQHTTLKGMCRWQPPSVHFTSFIRNHSTQNPSEALSFAFGLYYLPPALTLRVVSMTLMYNIVLYLQTNRLWWLSPVDDHRKLINYLENFVGWRRQWRRRRPRRNCVFILSIGEFIGCYFRMQIWKLVRHTNDRTFLLPWNGPLQMRVYACLQANLMRHLWNPKIMAFDKIVWFSA